MGIVTGTKLLDVTGAAGLIRHGQTLMVGGFGLVGKPLALVDALLDNPEATDLALPRTIDGTTYASCER
jgi:acyl CoA:acetate/3-ketoacid CoA transferase alpha subunit